jgi:hypothetical protein
MRAFSFISIGIAGIGLITYFVMGDSAPSFILPLIVVSVIAAIFFLIANIVINAIQNRKQYQCVTCGYAVRGGNPARYGSVCPSCGGSTFK